MNRWPFLLATALCLVAVDARAQLSQFDTFLPARSLGVAGTGRAYAAGGNAIYLNPATLSATKQYIVGVNHTFAMGQVPVPVPDKPNIWHWENAYKNVSSATWTDSTDNSSGLAMGLTYNYIWDDNRSNVHGAIAYAFKTASVDILLGIGGHYMETALSSGTSLWSLDAGVALNFGNKFQIGLAGYNLLSTGRADDGFPMGLGGGIAYWTGSWMFGVDVSANFDAETKFYRPDEDHDRRNIVSYMGGIQYQVADTFFLRGGLRWDQNQETVDDIDNPFVYGLGASLMMGKYAVELGFQQNIKDTYDVMIGITIDLYNPASTLSY